MFDFKKILKKEKKVNKKIISYDWFIIKNYERKSNILKIITNLYIFKLFNFI